jgi:hypothetical protein
VQSVKEEEEPVRVLVEMGGNVYAQDVNGVNPLQCAE